MNEFLKTRVQVDQATKFIQDNGLVESGLSCKNWEIANVIPYLKDGHLLDMGSAGSVVLENAVKLGLKGKKFGIDLEYEDYPMHPIYKNEIALFKEDLMQTTFMGNFFDIITSLSVIEHEVNFEKFAKECGRLLRVGGKLYCSFDYWQPKPDYEKRKLYNLDWNILDRNDVDTLIMWCGVHGMLLTSDVDWTLQDAVINSAFCSPVVGVEYTFGILEFIKK